VGDHLAVVVDENRAFGCERDRRRPTGQGGAAAGEPVDAPARCCFGLMP
jgi:hypothetical protein